MVSLIETLTSVGLAQARHPISKRRIETCIKIFKYKKSLFVWGLVTKYTCYYNILMCATDGQPLNNTTIKLASSQRHTLEFNVLLKQGRYKHSYLHDLHAVSPQ